jgi:3-oxoacyl-[acyl-carrier protein] reductase
MVMDEDVAYETASRFDVRGRRVIVTGAAHGIGLGIASAYVGAGAAVALFDVDREGLDLAVAELSTRGSATGHVVDLRDFDAVTSAVHASAEALGGIDALVNNAGIFPAASLDDMESDAFLDVLNVNVVGYARMFKACRPHLLAAGCGAVVNISSHTFHWGGPPMMNAYVTSKGGVIGLTRTLARDFGPQGITVNSVAPGAIPTRAERSVDPAVIGSPEEFNAAIMATQHVQRRGSVGDIAAATLFLTSEAASFISGQTLLVDGGWAVH